MYEKLVSDPITISQDIWVVRHNKKKYDKNQIPNEIEWHASS